MPVTLAQAKLNATDDIDVNIIDEFQKSSYLLNALTFDDVVSGAGNGATLTYGYTRQITQRGAAFRAINAEYTPTEVTKARYTVDLKPLGGSFQIDRVLNAVARGSETAFQLRELVKGTRAKFADAVINGDSAVDTNGFDGLDKILTGTDTELLPSDNGVTVNYYNWTTVADAAGAFAVIGVLEDWLSMLDGRPDAILGNRRAIAKLKQIALFGGFYQGVPNGFGGNLDTYNGIALIDVGEIAGAATEVIPIETRDADGGGAGGNITGLTDLYAVRFGLDGFHAVSMAGQPLVKTWLPDFTSAGAVKTGEVELGPAAVVLKRTKAASVLRNIKVS
jgi:hypothetical protein